MDTWITDTYNEPYTIILYGVLRCVFVLSADKWTWHMFINWYLLLNLYHKCERIHDLCTVSTMSHTIHIKGLSGQYRCTLTKCKVRVYFKGTSTIKSLLMHPKDPIPDAQKTDIIYHWKCPANNCTTEYIGETNRSLKERALDHRNQTTSAIRNHHISTKHSKQNL